MNRIKNILQKNGESDKVGDVFTEDENGWFCTNGKDLHYFLEEDSDFKRDTKDKDDVKKQNCLNLSNSEKINPKCEVERNQLINHLSNPKPPTDLD